jgi:hypothetical protein
MPTLGAHVSAEEFEAVKLAAQASPEKLPGPYAAEAIRDRLRREGKMPGAENEEIAKITAKVAEAIRKDRGVIPHVEAALTKATRRRMVA